MGVRNFLLTIIALGVAGAVYGDGGMIPFYSAANVFEPRQRAVIAWNGEEEILVLSTDTYASTATKGLEVVPLRNEPAVKKGDPDIFEKAMALIAAKTAPPPSPPRWGAPAGGPPMSAPAGEVTRHERIGRHDIAVTHVLDESGFCAWAEEYLRSQGAETPTIPDWIHAAIQGYVKRGFNWFVYDVVDLETSVRTNDPIQFRFKSDCVF